MPLPNSWHFLCRKILYTSLAPHWTTPIPLSCDCPKNIWNSCHDVLKNSSLQAKQAQPFVGHGFKCICCHRFSWLDGFQVTKVFSNGKILGAEYGAHIVVCPCGFWQEFLLHVFRLLWLFTDSWSWISYFWRPNQIIGSCWTWSQLKPQVFSRHAPAKPLCMFMYYNLFEGLFPWVNTQSFLTVTSYGLSNEIPNTWMNGALGLYFSPFLENCLYSFKSRQQ